MPKVWNQARDTGCEVDVDDADSPNTNPTVSDVFFIACATGQVSVDVGEITCFEHGAIVVDGKRIEADMVIKCLGFDNNSLSNTDCGVLKVVGSRDFKFRPPIWITPRVFNFRNEADLHPLSEEELSESKHLYNLPYAATLTCELWVEIFLFFRTRPAEAKQILDKLPVIDTSRITLLDLSKGLYTVLSAYPDLQEKVTAIRQQFNRRFRERYSSQGSTDHAWIAAFLQENKSDWQDMCMQLTGDPNKVPYVWNDLLSKMNSE